MKGLTASSDALFNSALAFEDADLARGNRELVLNKTAIVFHVVWRENGFRRTIISAEPSVLQPET